MGSGFHAERRRVVLRQLKKKEFKQGGGDSPPPKSFRVICTKFCFLSFISAVIKTTANCNVAVTVILKICSPQRLHCSVKDKTCLKILEKFED